MIAISLPTDKPDYTVRVTLGGSDFVLAMQWSEREARWYLSLFDSDEVAIVRGVKVVADWPLLRRIADDRRPSGDLYAIDSLLLGEPPTYDGFASRWALVYA